ncbi:MAG: hypothetical protein HYR63_03700 [Proteobacteria bacterium]|nr:hypothetical protein [Pseudomonadota bacterium]MBI3498565.1 hypothetical protein [Pseudomonadota bacterium]
MSRLSQSAALALIARSIAEIVGPASEAYRDILKAAQSGQLVDVLLAQAAFDALPGALRHRIADRVAELSAERDEKS